MSLDLQIKSGAFIVADAHYSSHHRPELKTFFESIAEGTLQPTQLILMGDIFDTLFAPIPYTLHVNQDMIELLDRISQKIEVVYLEGNHDFCLTGIFKNIQIYSLSKQPISAVYNDQKVLLAHGDFGERMRYKLYTSVIRSRFVLNILRFIDTLGGHFILKKLDTYLQTKEDCNTFTGFEEYVKRRLEQRFTGKCNVFIEGHFHQDTRFKIADFSYINLGAFACNQRYFIVQSSQELLLEGKNF